MLAALLQNNQQRHAVGPGAPTTTCLVLAGLVQGVAITPQTMVGSGGAGGPYTFSATGLPSGLTLASNGLLSGTPSTHGTFPYTVTVRDSASTPGTVNCSVTVAPPVTPPPPGPAKSLTGRITMKPRMGGVVEVGSVLQGVS